MDSWVPRGFLWMLGFLRDLCDFSGFWGILEGFRDSRGFLWILGFLGSSCVFSGFQGIFVPFRVSS